MKKIIELARYATTENCTLNKETGEMNFSRTSNLKGFTGLYYRDDNYFFGIYPTEDGPIAYFEGKEYKVHRDLDIQYIRSGKDRKFKIVDYNIEIDYTEMDRLGWDLSWLEEDEVDLFCMIEKRYKGQEFYEQYTLGANN